MLEIFDIGIIGMGPSGIGLAMSLEDSPKIRNTICFERGTSLSSLNCHSLSKGICECTTFCSIISGVGGASKLTSGKISNYPAGSGLSYFFDTEEQLVDQLHSSIGLLGQNISLRRINVDDGAMENAKSYYTERNINYKYYDVYEFDGEQYRRYLENVIHNLKRKGLTLSENTEICEITRVPVVQCYRLTAKTPCGYKYFFVRDLVLATGALDIQDKLCTIAPKKSDDSFEIGVRIEVPSAYFENALTAHGDLKLKKGLGRTYCVSANGSVISYQTKGVQFLEGCIDTSTPTSYTNLAVLIKTNDYDAVSGFIDQYSSVYNGVPLKQRYIDYMRGQPSSENTTTTTTLLSAVCGDINDLLPVDVNTSLKSFINDVLVNAMGIPANTITILAPELKILRNLYIMPDFSVDEHLYVVGAATGLFRGILQSLCSGMRCGQLLIGGNK